MREYKPAKHPKTGKWHAVGYIGGGQYMQIGGPFGSKSKVEKWISIQSRADADSKRLSCRAAFKNADCEF
jgi:hypothetical protein